MRGGGTSILCVAFFLANVFVTLLPTALRVGRGCVVEGGIGSVIDSLRRQKAARAQSVLGQASSRGLSALCLDAALTLTDQFQPGPNV